MSKPTDIYKTFTRELLENFVWQLQITRGEYEKALLGGLEEGNDSALAYSFECPSQEVAQSLEDYIHEQAEDEITIKQCDGTWILSGKSAEVGFELGMILGWVGYMCDAGNQFGCRFDGWSPAPATNAAVDAASEAADSDESEGAAPASELEDSSYPHMVIAKILDSVEPMERGEKYEDPLAAVLEERGLGEVTGGGSQLNDRFQVAYVDIEIRLADLDEALELTKKSLRKLGAPPGSELRFAREVVVPIVD
ncbi:MAG: hypothetical protein J0M24_16455 [Verrucomicrobia bacterium]|nr:hypothetical protein [Verrucomicrobiota bacterium]